MIQLFEQIKFIYKQLSSSIAHVNSRAESANQKCDKLQEYFDTNLVINQTTNSRQSQNVDISTDFGNVDAQSQNVREFRFLYGSKLFYDRILPSSHKDVKEVVNFQTLIDYVNSAMSGSGSSDMSGYLKSTGSNRANGAYVFDNGISNSVTFNCPITISNSAIFNGSVTFGSPTSDFNVYSPTYFHSSVKVSNEPKDATDVVRKADLDNIVIAASDTVNTSYYIWNGSTNDLSLGSTIQSRFLSTFFNVSTNNLSLVCIAPCVAIVAISKTGGDSFSCIKGYVVDEVLTPNSLLPIGDSTTISIAILGAVALPGNTHVINYQINMPSSYTIRYDTMEVKVTDMGSFNVYTADPRDYTLALVETPVNATLIWSVSIAPSQQFPEGDNNPDFILGSVSGSTLTISYHGMPTQTGTDHGVTWKNAISTTFRISCTIKKTGLDDVVVTKDVTFTPSFV